MTKNSPSTIRDFTPDGEINILTWGSQFYENPYWGHIRKRLQGKNPGHAAFTLNLPDTPENKITFNRLVALGYAGDVVKTPKIIEAIQEDGNVFRTTVPGEWDNRYIIRFSTYFTGVANAAEEGRIQKGRRESSWDEERFRQLKSAQMLSLSDLKRPKENKKEFKILKKSVKQLLLTKLDQLNTKDDLVKFFIKNDLSEEMANKWADRIEALLREKYVDYFKEQFKDSFKELDEEQRNIRIKKLVDDIMDGREFSVFRKAEGEKFRNISKTIHLNRLQDSASPYWTEDNKEAAEIFYQTTGQPPDRVVTLPLTNQQFTYGLDGAKVAKEMEKIKIKTNQNAYNYIKNHESEDEKEKREKIESDLIDQGKRAGMDLSTPLTLKDLFEVYIYLKDYTQNNKADIEAANAVKNFSDLWQSFYERMDNDDVFIQDEMIKYAFNCCRRVKDCLQAGLDSTYQGYYSDPFIAGALTSPSELATESDRLSDAIRRDRFQQMTSGDKESFDSPPLGSRIKGWGLGLKNLNYTLLPSRTIIRPVISMATAMVSLPATLLRFFSSKPEHPYHPSSTLSDKEQGLVSSAAIKRDDAIDKVFEFNENDHQPFLLSERLYQKILKNLDEAQCEKYGYDNVEQLKQAFIDKYTKIRDLSFKAMKSDDTDPKSQNRKAALIYHTTQEKMAKSESESHPELKTQKGSNKSLR